MSAARPNACVFAGAGTGKTHGLVTECLRLLGGADRDEPLPPAKLCLLTFTEKAAAEMRGRLAARVAALAAGEASEPELAAAFAAAGRPVPSRRGVEAGAGQALPGHHRHLPRLLRRTAPPRTRGVGDSPGLRAPRRGGGARPARGAGRAAGARAARGGGSGGGGAVRRPGPPRHAPERTGRAAGGPGPAGARSRPRPRGSRGDRRRRRQPCVRGHGGPGAHAGGGRARPCAGRARRVRAGAGGHRRHPGGLGPGHGARARGAARGPPRRPAGPWREERARHRGARRARGPVRRRFSARRRRDAPRAATRGDLAGAAGRAGGAAASRVRRDRARSTSPSSSSGRGTCWSPTPGCAPASRPASVRCSSTSSRTPTCSSWSSPSCWPRRGKERPARSGPAGRGRCRWSPGSSARWGTASSPSTTSAGRTWRCSRSSPGPSRPGAESAASCARAGAPSPSSSRRSNGLLGPVLGPTPAAPWEVPFRPGEDDLQPWRPQLGPARCVERLVALAAEDRAEERRRAEADLLARRLAHLLVARTRSSASRREARSGRCAAATWPSSSAPSSRWVTTPTRSPGTTCRTGSCAGGASTARPRSGTSPRCSGCSPTPATRSISRRVCAGRRWASRTRRWSVWRCPTAGSTPGCSPEDLPPEASERRGRPVAPLRRAGPAAACRDGPAAGWWSCSRTPGTRSGRGRCSPRRPTARSSSETSRSSASWRRGGTPAGGRIRRRSRGGCSSWPSGTRASTSRRWRTRGPARRCSCSRCTPRRGSSGRWCASPTSGASRPPTTGRLLVDPRNGLAFRPSVPWSPDAHPTPRSAALAEVLASRELAESRRVLYVAMTRARDHLVLSGIPGRGGPRAWCACD